MAELERSLCDDKLQFGMIRKWVLTDVMFCTSQRLKEIFFFFLMHTRTQKENENKKVFSGRQG